MSPTATSTLALSLWTLGQGSQAPGFEPTKPPVGCGALRNLARASEPLSPPLENDDNNAG